MNWKQSAKKANETINVLEEMIQEKDEQIASMTKEHEYSQQRSKRDITAMNECIDSMIQGGNPCDWCEEKRLGECEHPECDGKGCEGWWLKELDETETAEAEKADDGPVIDGSNT